MIDLERAKTVMVKILLNIDSICQKHRINYWIDFGTLLGAVRHNGFIPWDDDIDITMPREDYNRFLTVAQEELGDNYLLDNNKHTRRKHMLATKVRHKRSVYVEHGFEEDQPTGYNGIFVDIFPVDRISKKNVKKYNYLRRLYHISPFKPKYKSVKTRTINYALSFLILIRPLFRRQMTKLLDENGDMYILGQEIPFPLHYPFDLVFPLKKISFESQYFNCPKLERDILQWLFGDFMKMPPENQRRIHARDIKFFD